MKNGVEGRTGVPGLGLARVRAQSTTEPEFTALFSAAHPTDEETETRRDAMWLSETNWYHLNAGLPTLRLVAFLSKWNPRQLPVNKYSPSASFLFHNWKQAASGDSWTYSGSRFCWMLAISCPERMRCPDRTIIYDLLVDVESNSQWVSGA